MSIRSMASASLEQLQGVLIGTAVGDSIGLPMEGLSARRQAKLFPPPLRQRLVGPRGMISDDTEHAVMVAQALLRSPGDPSGFQRELARRLRWWLVSLPAGVGFATLRAILKLWVGFPASRSGIYSAGNGPAMRSALLGVYFSDDEERRRAFTSASAEITHRDPRAIAAAMAVADTAAWMIRDGENAEPLIHGLMALCEGDEWRSVLTELDKSLSEHLPVKIFARRIGAHESVSGYALRSVPVAIYAALLHRTDFANALAEVVQCGGDTDTMGAIAGALVGARGGPARIPESWRKNLKDYPCSTQFLERLAAALQSQRETGDAADAISIFWPAVPFRNLGFLTVVLAHGFRRLLPPY